MVLQLIIGSCAIAVSVMIQAVFAGTAIAALRGLDRWVTSGALVFKLMILIVVLTLWMLAGLTAAVWMWAVILLQLGIFNKLEIALYFAIVAFTTLGFGDVILPEAWRLLSGLIAANGLILFGLITAFLIEAIGQIGRGQRHVRSSRLQRKDKSA